MEVTSWYQEAFIYAYYVGGGLLVLTSLIVLLKKKSVISMFCLIGFLGFMVGNIMLSKIDSALSEARQTNTDTVQLEKKWILFRAISSVGFLLGGVGLVVLVGKSRNAL